MKPLNKIFSTAANLQEHPGDRAQIGRRDSQMLHGEEFEVLSLKGVWVYGRSILDGYQGYINDIHLTSTSDTPTHAINRLTTNVYKSPDFKTRPADNLSFMSRVTPELGTTQNGFIKLKDQQLWVPENHLVALKALTANPADIVDTAMMFVGTPYLYGGRSAGGIDCSGLVQLALQRNGISCPRDADMQEPVMGHKIWLFPRRGDIVYFNDHGSVHVGIMADSKHVVNANVRDMGVIVEKLSDMKKYYGGLNGEPAVKSIRRLDF